MSTAATLERFHRALLERLGPSGWWPGETPFEVAVGAILTQNTSWANVSKAIANLAAAQALEPAALRALPLERLEELIRPSGYFRMKARKLHALLDFLDAECGGTPDARLEGLQGRPWEELRPLLLDVRGIGPETADSILCYALAQPVFVVDAYTARICSRHGLIPEETDYQELQALFMDALEPDTALCNEFHALLVRVGHGWCAKQRPRCQGCPLEAFLE
ncbi:MAG: endonuclease III domain-containing protein [Desulfovibrio sp.]